VLGWLWRVDWLRRHANERSDWNLGKWWNYLIRIGIPIVLGSLFFWSLFDDLTQEGGFLCDPDGGWILTNCVGLSVMAVVPVAAVVISLVRGRSDIERKGGREEQLPILGRAGGAIASILAVASAVLVLTLLKWAVLGRSEENLLWASLPPAVIAVIIGNYLLDRHHSSTTRASWLARLAGMVGIMDISGFVALSLIYYARSEAVAEVAEPVVHPSQDQLSTVSYIILSIVFLLIICGLGWCFYRALSAASGDAGIQEPDNLGDREQHASDDV